MRTTTLSLLFFLVPAAAHADRCEYGDSREICLERNIFLMPGVHASFYAPSARGVAPFVGGGVTFAPILWSHNTDEFGPSQGTVFFQASLLRSPSSQGSLGLFESGITLSFERNSSRRFAIPFFGFAAGGTLHDELPNAGYLYPMAGVHLFWHQNLVLGLEGGYHFPFQAVDDLRGPRAQAIAQFSMW